MWPAIIKKKLKFKNNSTFGRFLLKTSSLWKLRLAIIICACLVFTVPIFKSPRFLFFLKFIFMFLDIDECNSTKPLTRCDQICENIVGSYNCSCQKGFNLVNGSRCEGTSTILLTLLRMLSTRAWAEKKVMEWRFKHPWVKWCDSHHLSINRQNWKKVSTIKTIRQRKSCASSRLLMLNSWDIRSLTPSSVCFGERMLEFFNSYFYMEEDLFS